MLSLYLAMLDNEQEKQTFTRIYERYKATCLHVALQITKDYALAEDAVHNAFLSIIKQRENFLSISCGKLRSRIVIIVKNKAIDILRKESKSIPAGDDIEEVPSGDEDFTLQIESKDGFEHWVRAIGQIPELYRLTAELRFFHDMEYSEIAETLGITVKAVSMRLNRAKGMIQEIIRDTERGQAQ
jgi:RNA polymerase sigma-70 factor (ECF subfamily)